MKRTAQSIEENKAKIAQGSEPKAPKYKKKGYNAKSKSNLKPFPKGISGNPGGLPGTDLSAVLARRIFEECGEEIQAGMSQQLKKGNAYAFSVVADRAYGKIKEKHEVTGADGESLAITIKLVKTEAK